MDPNQPSLSPTHSRTVTFMYQGPRLDTVTIFFAISMVGFLMSGIAYSARKATPDYASALAAWSWTMFLAGCAFMLFFLRGYAPLLLSFSLGNTLVMLVPAFGLLAHARLFGRNFDWPVVAIGTGGGLLGAIGVPTANLPMSIGIALLSAGGALTLAASAIMLAREFFNRRLASAGFGAVVAGLTGLGFAARAVVSATGDPGAVVYTSNSSAQIGPMLLCALFALGSSMAFFAMVHARQRDALLEQSQRDGLTGIYTRAAFFEKVAKLREQPSVLRSAVVMLDIDHFKAINDTYGHRGGDLALAHAARQIASGVRLGDLVGRYGGEEFCVFLPGCSPEDAESLAHRLVDEARQQSVRLQEGSSVRYTLSAGYAVEVKQADAMPHESLDAFIERADRALYEAKRSGRNRAMPAEKRSSVLALSH